MLDEGSAPYGLRAIDRYPLVGELVVEDGKFSLSVKGALAPPPEPEPPSDVIVITPTGGDDAGLIQGKLNELPAGKTLMLSGMFNVGSTIWFDGPDRVLMGDPAKQSGMRATKAGLNGHYGALLCTTNDTKRCAIRGLELDAQSKPVELVFFDGGADNVIENCFLHDIIYDPSGPPFAAIHSQNTVNLKVLKNKIQRTTGIDGGAGVRGIWVPGIGGALVDGNIVEETGHTGISIEGANGVVVNNQVRRSLVQGTAYKVCYRGSGVGFGYRKRLHGTQPAFSFRNNFAQYTKGAALMLQNLGGSGIVIENNSFLDIGASNSTFGAVYSSTPAQLNMKTNRLERCRSVGCFRDLYESTFEDTTFVGGVDLVYLEQNCHYITLRNSGKAQVGPGCDNITVDGIRVA